MEITWACLDVCAEIASPFGLNDKIERSVNKQGT